MRMAAVEFAASVYVIRSAAASGSSSIDVMRPMRNDVRRRPVSMMLARVHARVSVGSARVLNSFRGNRLTGPGSNASVDILNLKIEPNILRTMLLPYPDPDGRIDTTALTENLMIYRNEKLIDGTATVEQVVDTSFIVTVAKQSGAYRLERS